MMIGTSNGNSLTTGLWQQARRCTECSMIAHADCTHLVPDFCKMLMETAIRLLQEIKTAQSFQSNRIRAIASAKSTSNSGHSIQLGVSRLQLRTNEPRAFPVPKTAKYQLCQPGMATSTGSQSSKPVSSDQVPLPHSLPYHPCPLPSNPDAPPSMSPTKGPSQSQSLSHGPISCAKTKKQQPLTNSLSLLPLNLLDPFTPPSTVPIWHQNLLKSLKPLRPMIFTRSLADKLDNFTTANQSHYIAPWGLINNGNLCFANAVRYLSLVFESPLSWLFIFFSLLDFANETFLLDAMVAFVQEFRVIEQSNSPTPGMNNCSLTLQNSTLVVLTDKSFIAESVWAATKGDSQFYSMGKHDHLVQLKHQEISATAVKKLDLKQQFDKISGGIDWLEVGSKGQAVITHLDSVTFEPNNVLQLLMKNPSITTIEHALAHFSSPDVILDMKTKSGQKFLATKQVYIETFPLVFILHIKQFNYDSKDGSVRKFGKDIKFKTIFNIPSQLEHF
ncbi:hypothetical protein PPACK8108_LOCUS14555 [Phakopsora pachyrhizi]|uniref:ubiquitinyl hydrolase 1 n=1 Tax=Phakopsora pachyrhizi TaxID=170000 RepID=A0AAV0B5A1_PHAPC|nr:hypothetical protein PPACK8108_LOCUS14555 [Phakopsora pachyrhizi]